MAPGHPFFEALNDFGDGLETEFSCIFKDFVLQTAMSGMKMNSGL